ncbi:MAG: hypothetical protein AAF682_31865 [Planctomycetota bacterium]
MVGLAMLAGAALSAVVLMSGSIAGKNASVDRYRVRARYLAEGAAEVAKKDLVEAVANFDPVPATGTAEVGGMAIDYEVAPTGLSTITTDASGIQTLVDGYRIQATAEVEGYPYTAFRIVNVEATPIFQFAVFYTDDLEILPGPSMTLGGRVHSNGSMYLGCGSTLTMNTNYVRAVGDIYRTRKDKLKSSGSVQVRRWVVDPYDPSEPEEYVRMNSKSQMESAGVETESGYDSAFDGGWDEEGDGDFYGADDWLPWGPGALELWSSPDGYGIEGNTVRSAAHGTPEAIPPSIGSIAMFEELDGGDYVWSESLGEYVQIAPGTGTHGRGYYHASADLVILVEGDGDLVAYDSDGYDVTGSLGGAVKVTTMYDARQSNTEIGVTEIDIDALNASGVFPANGLLYAASYGAGEGEDTKGVVLKNGAELSEPLTVVTEGSVYVQGDYNTVGKKPAAVIADAVNLLSNDWTGTKAKGSLPKAAETTYNLAFITGNHETVGSKYNGGLENLPRFHESWSGVNCNLTGSFVNAWFSQYATGKWKYGGDVYQAPKRNFSYDEDFNDVSSLPPFTPMAVQARDIVSW